MSDETKYEELLRYSNPSKVYSKLCKYLRRDVDLYVSSNKRKKYMIQRPDGKWVHFGAMGYEDFTQHKDDLRRIHYLQRAQNIRGNWRDNPYSANNLAIHGLW